MLNVSRYRVTLINAEKLPHELYFHPDQTQVDYMILGHSNGFHLGFNPLAVSLKSASQNLPSASLQPPRIGHYMEYPSPQGLRYLVLRWTQ